MNSKMIEELKPCPREQFILDALIAGSTFGCGKCVDAMQLLMDRSEVELADGGKFVWNTRTAYDPDKRLIEALEKCRDKFAEYVELHSAKIVAPDRGDILDVRDKANAAAQAKADRNREMVVMIDAALSHNGG